VADRLVEGYADELRQSIVAGVLTRLSDRIDEKVPRFLTVIEEAHNFIPNRIDGTDAPSLPIIKQIATEGRKYGMGLVFISPAAEPHRRHGALAGQQLPHPAHREPERPALHPRCGRDDG
jgi:hypothetical protein